MDKITRIHLAKIPYEIGISAQEHLEKYLDAIRNELDRELADEIMTDIEVRITEILGDRNIKRNDVITLKDVEAIQQQIGSPEQFGDSVVGDDVPSHSSEVPKKLLRDTDGAFLGGVASGLGAYFKIDPIFVRLIFILLTLVSGLGIVLYILLWILVPPARSSSEKLLMKGQPATAAALQSYRSGAQRTIDNIRFKTAVKVIFQIFRFFFSIWAAFFVLGILSAVGFLTAILYTQPLRQPFLDYHLNYLLLGLIWLFMLSVVGIIVIVLLRLWRQGSTKLRIAFVSLTSILVLTIAGGAVVSPFVVNHYKNQYAADKIAVALPVTSTGVSTVPQTLSVQANSDLNVTYVVTTDPIHATFQDYPGMGNPKISIANNKGTITVQTGQLTQVIPNCLLNWCHGIYLPVRVTLYGPPLQNYNVNYGAELDLSNLVQKNTSLTAQNNSSINIDSSYSNNISLVAQSGGSINASDTSTQTAIINIADQSSYVFGPATSSLAATMPNNCNGSLLELNQAPASLTINNQLISSQSLSQNNCIALDDTTPFFTQTVHPRGFLSGPKMPNLP